MNSLNWIFVKKPWKRRWKSIDKKSTPLYSKFIKNLNMYGEVKGNGCQIAVMSRRTTNKDDTLKLEKSDKTSSCNQMTKILW